MLKNITEIINKSFALLVIVFAVAAFYFPATFKPIAKHIPVLLGIVMLGMGLTLTKQDFSAVFTRPKDVLIGVVMQFIIMPLIGVGVAMGLNMSPELAAGFILVGCVPSGTSSNVMTFLAKGDVALSVTMSSVTTLLAPFVTPYLFLLLGGKFIPINAWALFVDIVKIVLIPVILGVVLRQLFAKYVEALIDAVPLVSVGAIIAIVSAVVAASAGRLSTVAGVVVIGVILHNLLGYFIACLVSKYLFSLDHRRCKTMSFEIGMQNSGLGAALAMAHLNPLAALPSAIFSVWHNISGSMLAGYWAKRDK